MKNKILSIVAIIIFTISIFTLTGCGIINKKIEKVYEEISNEEVNDVKNEISDEINNNVQGKSNESLNANKNSKNNEKSSNIKLGQYNKVLTEEEVAYGEGDIYLEITKDELTIVNGFARNGTNRYIYN